MTDNILSKIRELKNASTAIPPDTTVGMETACPLPNGEAVDVPF